MNDKEVIERLNRFKTIKVMYGNTFAMHLEQLKQLQSDIETVLNLIQTQQAEIKKKDDKLKDIKNHIKAELKMIDKLYNEVGWVGKEQYDGMKAAYKMIKEILKEF